MEIHQLPKRNAIISFEVIEAQETQFDTSVLTSKEKRALLDLTQSYNPLVTYTSGNNEFDRCENDINGDIIEKCDKSI
jgi:hypothetical protein